jgi:nucleoside recognition membrane protein YjiH
MLALGWEYRYFYLFRFSMVGIFASFMALQDRSPSADHPHTVLEIVFYLCKPFVLLLIIAYLLNYYFFVCGKRLATEQ